MMTLKRREFLKTSAGFGLLGFAAMSGLSACASSAPVSLVRGVQLYTLRKLMKEDVSKTLFLLAETGITEVEFAGYFGHSPADIRGILDGLNLTSPSVHSTLELIRDDLDNVIEQAHTIGHKYIVMPWLEDHQRTSLDQFKSYADLFNKAGEACKKASLQLLYHNHAFEFETLDGGEPYEILLERTDPELLKMEIDLYWTAKAGRDPLTYFKRFPGRFPLCHVKDMAKDGSITEVGAGVIDFPRIFRAAKEAGFEHYFIEHDHPKHPLRSVRESIKHLNNLKI